MSTSFTTIHRILDIASSAPVREPIARWPPNRFHRSRISLVVDRSVVPFPCRSAINANSIHAIVGSNADSDPQIPIASHQL
jgi:hypothetical protein